MIGDSSRIISPNPSVVKKDGFGYLCEKRFFLYRVTGILLNKGKMLLSTDDYVDFWVLPDGSVKLFELSEDAIKR